MNKMTEVQEGMTCQEPEELHLDPEVDEEGQGGYSLDTVNPGSSMHDHILADFANAGLHIDKIERLTNSHLKKRYITERDLMYEQRVSQDSNYKLNEKFLYHGTTAKKMYICEEGLDSRVSKEGCFGKGIYFSDYPRKCVKYAEKGGSTESIILLMRVILGDAKIYQKGVKDKSLRREPEKPQPYTGFRFFDSVQGCPVNHREFVVYENRRALVECIITYTKPQSQTASKDTQSSETNMAISTLQDDFEDSDTSNSDDDDGNATSSDDDDDDDALFKCEETKVPDTDPTDKRLQLLENDFSHRTGIKDKHLIHTFLLMGNLDLDEAVELYNNATKKKNDEQGGDQQDQLNKMMENIEISKPNYQVNQAKWKAMSAADREAATQSLMDDFLEVIGRDKQDEESRHLARRYLGAVDMNLDLAIVCYYEELADSV